MTRLGVALIAAAAVMGLILIMEKGLVVLWFGLAGVSLAIVYSLGPLKLNSTGFGEFATGLAFGVIPVTGAAWLQSGLLDQTVVLFSLPIAFWVTAILLINEVPDIAADASTGKRTLPVRFGLNATSVVYFCLHLGSALTVTSLAWNSDLPVLAPVVPVLLLVLAARASRAIRTGVADRASMTGAIEATLGIHTIGSLWLIGCALYLGFVGAA
jgi:1,4-dihydroxy-2-naphthoate octaprenyltransferase